MPRVATAATSTVIRIHDADMSASNVVIRPAVGGGGGVSGKMWRRGRQCVCEACACVHPHVVECVREYGCACCASALCACVHVHGSICVSSVRARG
eukprot:scaffold2619_cov123-Isochrysis_galbana.AAC.8